MDDFIRRYLEQQEMMRRAVEGASRYFRENRTVIEEVQRLVRTADELGVGKTALAAQKFLQSSYSALDTTNALFAKAALPESIRQMQTYADQHRKMFASLTQAALPYQSLTAQIKSMGVYFDAARFAASTIDYERIGSLISIAERQRATLTRLTASLSVRHSNLIASLDRAEGQLASVPPFVSALPTLGVFVHTSAVRSITPHDDLEDTQEQQSMSLRLEVTGETVAFLEGGLYELKPAFLDQYRGAKLKSHERGPDWWTHGGASMRKLLKGVLHTAAPNEIVLPWAQQEHKELDRNGRPARTTKIEWLCQFIANKDYRAFVRTELNSALALIDILDATQHVDEFPEFEDQYNWPVLRVEVAIRHILTIWKARRAH